MNALLFRCMIVSVLILSSGTASMARTATSTYCIAIAVSAENKDILAAKFDEFARKAGLFIDSSSPIMRVYTPEDVASPIQSNTIIMLHKMGPLGSILTYTSMRNPRPADLLEQLKHFVSESIVGAYKIKQCDEIKGFTPPVLYY